jgi:hypothetical protein
MRLPAYGKALLKLREAGKVPWVVVVALGHIIDTEALRGQAGVARIGLPFDFPIDTGDLAILRGLDVLVSCFAPETVSALDAIVLHRRAIAAIHARGEPGLLWCASQDRMTASPLWKLNVAGVADFVSSPSWEPLDRNFRHTFAWWRKCALLGAEGIFARPEFDPVRERVRRELSGGRVSH